MKDYKEWLQRGASTQRAKEERQEYMKKCFMAFMQTEVLVQNNINILQEIYEYIMPANNEALVERYNTHLNQYMGKNMNEIIYLDMIAVLAEKIVNEKELCEWFINKIKSRYIEEFNIVVDYAQMNVKNITYKEYKRREKRFEKCFEGNKASDEKKREFLNFVLFYYMDEHFLDIEIGKADRWYDSYLIGENEYDKGIRIINESMTEKMDWTNDFSKSSVIEKYVKKQTELLARHKGVSVNELLPLIRTKLDDNDMIYLALIIIKEYGIRSRWFMDIVKSWSSEKMKGRIEAYYRHQLFFYWADQVNEVESISKLDITRRMPERDYEHDFEIIVNSVVVDIMAELYVNLTKEFYKNFSFEKITNKSLSERYENKILEYESVVERKNRQIKNIQDENFRMKVLLDKKHFAEGQQEYIKELEVAIDEKEAEIERLCQQSTQKDAYIELLSKGDEEERQEYDLLYLQSKRYLFVGWETKLQQELKKIFPNSIFMTSNTTNIEGIRVDAVVYLTKSMKHSMYYKVASSKLVKTVPVVNYNGKRCEGVYGEMYAVLADYYKDNNPKTA